MCVPRWALPINPWTWLLRPLLPVLTFGSSFFPYRQLCYSRLEIQHNQDNVLMCTIIHWFVILSLGEKSLPKNYTGSLLCCLSRAADILTDPYVYHLLDLLPSGTHFRSIITWRNRFYPEPYENWTHIGPVSLSTAQIITLYTFTAISYVYILITFPVQSTTTIQQMCNVLDFSFRLLLTVFFSWECFVFCFFSSNAVSLSLNPELV